MVSGGLVEAAQEVGQQTGSNVAAKVTYDPSRDPYQGVIEGGIVAGISGGAVGGAMSGRVGRSEKAQKDDEERRQQVEDIRKRLEEAAGETIRPALPAMAKAPERTAEQITAAPTSTTCWQPSRATRTAIPTSPR